MITLSDKQLEALKKIINIGMVKAADTLKNMLDSHIELEAPSIIMFDPENPGEEPTDLSHHEIHIDNHAGTKVELLEKAFVYSVSANTA